MFSDKVFRITLLVSIFTHTVILFQNSGLNIFPAKKNEQKLEVNYIKEAEKVLQQYKSAQQKKEAFLDLPSRITAKKIAPPPFVDNKESLKNSAASKLPVSASIRPSLIKPDIIAIKKKITLPPIDINKINNASYISYYQIIREKIRRAAYQNYNRTDTGEVYLSFLITSDGSLKDIRCVEEKSSHNSYLKEIALRSVKDASPFPVFPKELNYPQLSFNVVISFEVE